MRKSSPTLETSDSTIPVSLFAILREQFGDTLQPLRCTKATLVHISHTLEDLVLSQQLPALLFTGFQESSHWRKETERYRALATIAQQVCIFAGGTLPAESLASELHVTLRGDDPLRQEWFLALLCPQFAVLLCGQDRQVPAEDEATRQFDTLWSFKPAVIDAVLDRLEAVIESYRPERLAALRAARQSFPLVAPDPDLVTRFTAELIRFEEELHQRLMHTRQQLEQQMRWREDLLAMLVHDLRNPLQAVDLVFDLLQMPEILSREQLADACKLGTSSVQHMRSQVQLILDTNQLAEGELQLDVRRHDPAVWLQTALQACQLQAQSDGVTLETQVHVPLLYVDSELLGRALVNLVSNSLKYTPRQGTVLVTLAPAPKQGWVELRVRDTGRGIAAADVPRIFDRYNQGQRNDRRGYGLGLYFCRLVAEAHGGTIRATSEVGTGTTITLTLPSLPLLRSQ